MVLQKIAGYLLWGVLFVVAGCASRRQTTEIPAPGDPTTLLTAARRADPGYIHYLEKQSLLGASYEAARIVSGSGLAWQRPASPPSPEGVLHEADSWLYVHPLSLVTTRDLPVFGQLGSPDLGRLLERSALKGLYIAPTSGSGRLWAYDRNAGPEGEDSVQFGFSEAVGGEKEYNRLLQASLDAHRLLGMDILPAATGQGPDFFLAARNVRSYPGLYCMVEVPQAAWRLLPDVPNQWSGAALEQNRVLELAELGLLPPAMASDSPAFLLHGEKAGGWAATGAIIGIDGLPRRWAYRFHGDPTRPVLHWEDPSQAARQVLSAGIIHNVGLRGSALAGIRLEGLYGLEAAAPTRVGAQGAPGIEAAVSLGREIRRYGGWSWLRDPLPLSVLEPLLREGPDFLTDSITSPAAEHALLTGDTALLRFMMDAALSRGVDSRRLAHAMPAYDGIPYHLPFLADLATRASTPEMARQAAALREKTLRELREILEASCRVGPKGVDPLPLSGGTLYTTSAGLAALALGAGNAEAVTREMLPMIRRGHLLLAFFKAMQPGLFLVSGQDLVGTLPLSWWDMADSSRDWDVSLACRGAYSLVKSGAALPATARGIPRAKTVYPAPDAQMQDRDSFLVSLSRMLALRSRLAVARGALYGRFSVSHGGSLAFAVLLPPGKTAVAARQGSLAGAVSLPGQGGAFFARREQEGERSVTADTGVDSALVVVCNFSRRRVNESIDLAATPLLAQILEKGDMTAFSCEGTTAVVAGRRILKLTLDPWQAIGVVIGREGGTR